MAIHRFNDRFNAVVAQLQRAMTNNPEGIIIAALLSVTAAFAKQTIERLDNSDTSPPVNEGERAAWVHLQEHCEYMMKMGGLPIGYRSSDH